MSMYGSFIEIHGATPERLAQAQEEIRQKALEFLKEMDQPIEKMSDVRIITNATVAWRVEI